MGARLARAEVGLGSAGIRTGKSLAKLDRNSPDRILKSTLDLPYPHSDYAAFVPSHFRLYIWFR